MTNKEAVEVLKLMRSQIANDHKWLALDRAIKALKEARPEGRWIKNKLGNLDELGFVLCSKCRCGFKRYDRGTRTSDLPWIDGQPYELENRCNYCPTCGAKMLNANGPTEEE